MALHLSSLLRLSSSFLAAGLLAGCATTSGTHYYWGDYNEVVLSRYVTPVNMSPSRQVSMITQDILEAEKSQKPLAPGVYAHLGMAYAELGDMTSALNAFEEEMRRFPESRVFIEGMLERQKNAQQRNGRTK